MKASARPAHVWPSGSPAVCLSVTLTHLGESVCEGVCPPRPRLAVRRPSRLSLSAVEEARLCLAQHRQHHLKTFVAHHRRLVLQQKPHRSEKRFTDGRNAAATRTPSSQQVIVPTWEHRKIQSTNFRPQKHIILRKNNYTRIKFFHQNNYIRIIFSNTVDNTVAIL